jgi:hypothetical protein
MIDLRELADELAELRYSKEQVEDPENEHYTFEWTDEERLAQLEKLNSQMGDFLEYPRQCDAAMVVTDPAEYAKQYCEDQEIFNRLHEYCMMEHVEVDWKAIGEDLLNDYEMYEFDGDEFYVIY